MNYRQNAQADILAALAALRSEYDDMTKDFLRDALRTLERRELMDAQRPLEHEPIPSNADIVSIFRRQAE